MHNRMLAFVGLLVFGACDDNDAPTDASQRAISARQRGRRIWFESTFGGEKFFSLLLSKPPFDLPLGLDVALTSPRDTRFRDYGLLNDPDCTPGDATTEFWDRCRDPHSSGVIGIRKFSNPSPEGPRTLIGVACAACHAGLDPRNPPTDGNHPAWDNIHATIGNQYVDIGKIFKTHLSPHDPRYQVFQSWAPGTVDTTAIESDRINNPGMITPFFDLDDRPFFDLTYEGEPIHVHRSGQGGEDDTGCERAALRVYFNIGMCAAECMMGHLGNGPAGTQTPIDLDQCRAACPEFRQAEASVSDLCTFMRTAKPPRLEDAHDGFLYVDASVVDRGKRVFFETCASCHSNGRNFGHDVLSDDEVHPADSIGVNRCRADTTNWMEGHIWSAFSSDQYKARPNGGAGFYRDMPLQAVWATAPFLHNNRLGLYNGDPSVAGRIAAYEDAMYQLLHPEARDPDGAVQRTTDFIVFPQPGGPVIIRAGVAVASFANLEIRDLSARNLCPDLFENKGHYFGANLPESDKYALKEFLKTR